MLTREMHASLAVVATIAASRIAAAQPDYVSPPVERWSVTPLVGTAAGLDVAAGVQVEAPFRLRLMATVGEMPLMYAWGFKKLFLATTSAPDAMGELLENQVKDSFVARANLTWRPLARHGLFFGGGYTIQIADKDGLVAGTIENATGEMLPASDRGEERTFSTEIRAHLADGTIGWQWGLSRGFTLRAAVGVMVIFHTTTTFTPLYTPTDPAATAAFTAAASRKTNDAGTGTIVPEGSLYLGYTF